jgi:hypothetical protein
MKNEKLKEKVIRCFEDCVSMSWNTYAVPLLPALKANLSANETTDEERDEKVKDFLEDVDVEMLKGGWDRDELVGLQCLVMSEIEKRVLRLLMTDRVS